jgi:hypothetical protein
MSGWPTLDYLFDLQAGAMASAIPLNFSPYVPPPGSFYTGWDNFVIWSTTSSASPLTVFKFQAVEGATYDIFSSSWFDPFLIEVYDKGGNVVATNVATGYDPYGEDIVTDWVAPYSGTFYLTPGWDQGSYYTYASVSVYEDVATAGPMKITGTFGDDRMIGTYRTEAFYSTRGNDTIQGNGGNDIISGFTGIDTAVYRGARRDYAVKMGAAPLAVTDLTLDSTAMTVTDSAADRDGSDTLLQVERLKFSDMSLAFDLDGNAGFAARLLGAVFGASTVANKEYVGIALDYLDTGSSFTSLAQLALNVKLGTGASNAAVVDLLFDNLFGHPPSGEERELYANAIASGTFTQASLAAAAAMTTDNGVNVDLVGLELTGLAYV